MTGLSLCTLVVTENAAAVLLSVLANLCALLWSVGAIYVIPALGSRLSELVRVRSLHRRLTITVANRQLMASNL